MSDRELREEIRRAALDLGFDAVGFAPADPPSHGEAYRRWLERGWHGEMAYMAREDAVRRRLDPAEALPGCRTLIVVSLSYAPPATAGKPAATAEGTAPASPLPARTRPGRSARRLPVVARYARGRDYHAVFEERLAELAERIRALRPSAGLKPYVDYGPVLERDHAQRAGLGWIGRNTMLIHPRRGSYTLLGEMLTTLDLEPDDPFEPDHCGTCVRCIEACPTGAIREGRLIDARLCISYLTIELRGPIPEALRPAIGNRVFGCDICQEVCPWNGEMPAGDPELLAPPRPAAAPTMLAWAEEILDLSEEEFRKRYRTSALARPGRDGLLRNLCVGLGNSGDPRAREVLMRCRADDSPLVREHAAWALARLERAAGP